MLVGSHSARTRVRVNHPRLHVGNRGIREDGHLHEDRIQSQEGYERKLEAEFGDRCLSLPFLPEQPLREREVKNYPDIFRVSSGAGAAHRYRLLTPTPHERPHPPPRGRTRRRSKDGIKSVRKHTLDNGLVVLAQEDFRAPIVATTPGMEWALDMSHLVEQEWLICLSTSCSKKRPISARVNSIGKWKRLEREPMQRPG